MAKPAPAGLLEGTPVYVSQWQNVLSTSEVCQSPLLCFLHLGWKGSQYQTQFAAQPFHNGQHLLLCLPHILEFIQQRAVCFSSMGMSAFFTHAPDSRQNAQLVPKSSDFPKGLSIHIVKWCHWLMSLLVISLDAPQIRCETIPGQLHSFFAAGHAESSSERIRAGP